MVKKRGEVRAPVVVFLSGEKAKISLVNAYTENGGGMLLAFSAHDDQGGKSELGEIGEELRALARVVGGLSEEQPDFSEHMRDAQKELKAIACRLRGIN
jgi:hypothetical protein